MTDSERAERRARRLLRWYPKAWRLRYGEEFRELLIADIGEQPRSWRRTLDVARRGLAARIALRPAAATLVLVGTLLACLWAATYTTIPGDWANFACRTHCTPQLIIHLQERGPKPWTPRHAPGWAIPLATAVALAGSILALLIHRPRRITRFASLRR